MSSGADERLAHAAGDFTIEWIKVGAEACNDDIEAMIETTAFSDIFSIAEPDVGADGEVTGSCPRTYTSINAQGGLECLRLNAGMQLAASRFEFRRCVPRTCIIVSSAIKCL